MTSLDSGIWQTEKAQQWLGQFDEEDRLLASKAVESLLLVSDADFETEIVSLLAENKTARPTALFAVREVPRVWISPKSSVGKRIFTWVKKVAGKILGKSAGTSDTKGGKTYPGEYFSHTDIKKRPSAVGEGAGVGSEGIVARLIRNVSKTTNKAFLDHPSLHAMRSSKIQNVLFVDDFLGSGQRCVDFLKSFCRHPKIRSCISYKKISIRIIAYAATSDAIDRLRKTTPSVEVICAHTVAKGLPAWSKDERTRMESLCKKYSGRTSRPMFPLGFQNAFTFLLFQHKCPNTVPAIFWASKDSWIALFEEKPLLGLPTWPVRGDPVRSVREILQTINQTSLSESDWMSYVSPLGRQLLIVLSLVAKGFRKAVRIAQYARMSNSECQSLLVECTKRDWLTWDLRLTPSGLQELEYARTIKLNIHRDISTDGRYYFPQSLRAPKRSSSAGHP